MCVDEMAYLDVIFNNFRRTCIQLITLHLQNEETFYDCNIDKVVKNRLLNGNINVLCVLYYNVKHGIECRKYP